MRASALSRIAGRERREENGVTLREDGLEAARQWAASRHTTIRAFGVCRVTPEGRYVVAECASLGEARLAARQSARSVGFGRNPVIVALTPEGWSFEIEEVPLD